MADEDRTSPLLPIAKGLAYESDYRAFLSRQNLSGRSLRDVVSRTRRAAALADILAAGTDAEVVFRMTQDKRFELFSVNVKSQLKRAVLLYRAFHRERKGS